MLVSQLPEATQTTLKRHEAAGTTDSKQYQDAVEIFNGRYFNRKPKLVLPASCGASRRNDEIYRYMWGPNEFRATGTLRGFDVTQALRRLPMPVLVMVGQNDEARTETAAKFAVMPTRGRLSVIEECGHMAALENPGACAKVIQEFWSR